jgi:hypothetical protein
MRGVLVIGFLGFLALRHVVKSNKKIKAASEPPKAAPQVKPQ